MNSDRARVLFVCIGNSCRSQMAEGFARTYGSDVLTAESAGIAPAVSVSRTTVRLMDEKNIDLSGHYPKSLRQLREAPYDLVVNLTGENLGEEHGPVREWTVEDPIGLDDDRHRAIRDQIEMSVMHLILELRREQRKRAAKVPPSQ